MPRDATPRSGVKETRETGSSGPYRRRGGGGALAHQGSISQVPILLGIPFSRSCCHSDASKLKGGTGNASSNPNATYLDMGFQPVGGPRQDCSNFIVSLVNVEVSVMSCRITK